MGGIVGIESLRPEYAALQAAEPVFKRPCIAITGLNDLPIRNPFLPADDADEHERALNQTALRTVLAGAMHSDCGVSHLVLQRQPEKFRQNFQGCGGAIVIVRPI